MLLMPTSNTVFEFAPFGLDGECELLEGTWGLVSSISNWFVNLSMTNNSSRLAVDTTDSCPEEAGVRTGVGAGVGFVFCPELVRDGCGLSSS